MKDVSQKQDSTHLAQAELLKRAKQGSPEAIASLISRALQPKGITAAACVKEGCLHLDLTANYPPRQDVLVPFIHKGMERLGASSIASVVLCGFQSHTSNPVWHTTFDLSQTPAKLATTTSSQTDSNRHLSNKTLLSTSSKTAVNRDSSISAHIQAQSISGQVAVGNYILQIGHMSGGVVNFASGEGLVANSEQYGMHFANT